jgi:hypothetical protein
MYIENRVNDLDFDVDNLKYSVSRLEKQLEEQPIYLMGITIVDKKENKELIAVFTEKILAEAYLKRHRVKRSARFKKRSHLYKYARVELTNFYYPENVPVNPAE